MSNNNIMDFQSLDLGTGAPISVPMEEIKVEVTADDMVTDYAKAFVKETYRVSPLRAEQVKLTEEEMVAYAKFLLVKRIECVEDNCKDWRRLKCLYIPVFLQYALRMIGKVVIRKRGLTLIPDMTDRETITLEEAVRISDKVGAFEDELQLVQDAMPREVNGDINVMSTALIAGYFRSMVEVEHVSDTYISAFLGMKLAEEQAFAVLYRVQYDDIDFIRTALTLNKRLFT
jgi:hypothetical protein